MKILLNEKQEAIKFLSGRSDYSIPYWKYISILARYYWEKGFDEALILSNIIESIKSNYNNSDELKDSDCINSISKIIRGVRGVPLISIDSIPVTEKEMEAIKTGDSIPKQKILFTLLCLAKYGNYKNPKNNNWVNMNKCVS